MPAAVVSCRLNMIRHPPPYLRGALLRTDRQVGKMADLVLWKPSHFGAKPEMVIKGGTIAWAQVITLSRS